MSGNDQLDPDWADDQRKVAALLASASSKQAELARCLREMDSPELRRFAQESGDPSLSDIAAETEKSAYEAETMQRIHGEQARAYETFLAGGGLDNPDAVREWREACEWNSSLIPQGSGDGDETKEL